MKEKKLEVRVSSAEYEKIKAQAGRQGISQFVRTKLGLNEDCQDKSKDSAPKAAESTESLVRTNEPIVRTKASENTRVKPNQVCRALGHAFIMDGDKMVCSRCGQAK
jgi:hypothetical protein